VLLGIFIQIAIEIGIEIVFLVGDDGLIMQNLTFDIDTDGDFDTDTDTDFDGANVRLHCAHGASQV